MQIVSNQQLFYFLILTHNGDQYGSFLYTHVCLNNREGHPPFSPYNELYVTKNSNRI
jgi:hypothetical protein